MLILEGVRKRLGDITAVDGLAPSVARGEVLGLLGPNGAGKSTTVSLAVGLLAPDEGRVHLDGLGAPTTPAVRARLGVAPQALALYDLLTGAATLSPSSTGAGCWRWARSTSCWGRRSARRRSSCARPPARSDARRGTRWASSIAWPPPPPSTSFTPSAPRWSRCSCTDRPSTIPQFIMPARMSAVGTISPVKRALLAIEGALWREFTLAQTALPCTILVVVGAGCFAPGVRRRRV